MKTIFGYNWVWTSYGNWLGFRYGPGRLRLYLSRLGGLLVTDTQISINGVAEDYSAWALWRPGPRILTFKLFGLNWTRHLGAP